MPRPPGDRDHASTQGRSGDVSTTGVLPSIARNKPKQTVPPRSGTPWPPGTQETTPPYLSLSFEVDAATGGTYSDEWAWTLGTGGYRDGLWRCTVSVRLTVTFTGLTADGSVLTYDTTISSNPDATHATGYDNRQMVVVCDDTTKVISVRGQAHSWSTDPSSFVAGLETFGTTVTGIVILEIARGWTP